MSLDEEWHRYLQQRPEARLVVDRLMQRTALTESEALSLLLEAWIERNCTLDPPRQFDEWFYPSMAKN